MDMVKLGLREREALLIYKLNEKARIKLIHHLERWSR